MIAAETADAALLDLCTGWHRNLARQRELEAALSADDPAARATWSAEIPVLVAQGHALDAAIARRPATTLPGLRAKAAVFQACVAADEISVTGASLLRDLMREVLS